MVFQSKNVYRLSFYTLFKLKKKYIYTASGYSFYRKKKIFKASPTHLLLPAFLANSFLVMPINAKKSLVSTMFLSVETRREALSVGYSGFRDPTLSPGGSGQC